MTGRNCVAIDRNPVCCKGMVFRMQHLKGLPGPNVECGDAAGVCVDAEEEEVEVQAVMPSRFDKDKDDDDFTVDKDGRGQG